MGRAIVPSGASTGKHEARDLRDGDPLRYSGKGVRAAVANIQSILAPLILGMSASAQRDIDELMLTRDGTPDKSRLGANALLGVSLACAHAAAAARGWPLWQYLAQGNSARLPLPMVNLISGGLHAGGNLEMQDFLLLPIGARSCSEAIEMSVAVYRALAVTLREHRYESVLVADEGGFGPKLRNNEQALQLIMAALARSAMRPGQDAAIAIDVAATQFFQDGCYHFQGQVLQSTAMVDHLCR